MTTKAIYKTRIAITMLRECWRVQLDNADEKDKATDLIIWEDNNKCDI